MKKSFLFFISLMSFLVQSVQLFSQTTYYLNENPAGTVLFQIKKKTTFSTLTADEAKKIKVRKNLRFDISGLNTTTTFKIESTTNGGATIDITRNTSLITISGKQYIIAKTDKTISILRLTVTPSGSAPIIFDNIGSDVVLAPAEGTNVFTTYSSWRKYLEANTGGYLNIIKGKERYFAHKNIAYICLDPFGNIIGKKPVNIDQDDDVIILMVVPDTDDFDNYSINDNDAEYAPSDLSIRSNEEIIIPSIQSEDELDVSYTIKVFNKGPYTSNNVTFSAMLENKQLNNITIHVNPLLHLGLAVSYISSDLESPDFQLVPLTSSTTTIKSVNTGPRTFLTINAIWYWWPTLRYLAGSPITRGRDVLKEPSFLTRFNPTFGVELSRNIENNFFAGINFEFARGGSLTAGWHYGKTRRLLDRNFILGVTEFSGNQSEIKTENVWDWGGFVGVTLDTRIFNRLFSASRSNNQY